MPVRRRTEVCVVTRWCPSERGTLSTHIAHAKELVLRATARSTSATRRATARPARTAAPRPPGERDRLHRVRDAAPSRHHRPKAPIQRDSAARRSCRSPARRQSTRSGACPKAPAVPDTTSTTTRRRPTQPRPAPARAYDQRRGATCGIQEGPSRRNDQAGGSALPDRAKRASLIPAMSGAAAVPVPVRSAPPRSAPPILPGRACRARSPRPMTRDSAA
jgi:hypothetical protein